MLTLHKKIEITNLSIIQERVLNLIDINQEPRVYFPKIDHKFLEIPELVENLVRLGINLNNLIFGINIVKDEDRVIHIDYGHQDYSLNIPIKNCENTILNFYETSKSSVSVPFRIIDGVHFRPYEYYDPEFCKIIDTIDTHEAHLICVKQPHKVVNSNSGTRVMLLVRSNDNEEMLKILEN